MGIPAEILNNQTNSIRFGELFQPRQQVVSNISIGGKMLDEYPDYSKTLVVDTWNNYPTSQNANDVLQQSSFVKLDLVQMSFLNRILLSNYYKSIYSFGRLGARRSRFNLNRVENNWITLLNFYNHIHESADQEFNVEKFDEINKKVENEFSKNSRYLNIDIPNAKVKTDKISKAISNIQFEKIAVELTPSNAIKFTLQLDAKRILMVTYPYENISNSSNDSVIFSIFVSGKLILSDVKNIRKLVEGINKYTTV